MVPVDVWVDGDGDENGDDNEDGNRCWNVVWRHRIATAERRRIDRSETSKGGICRNDVVSSAAVADREDIFFPSWSLIERGEVDIVYEYEYGNDNEEEEQEE